MKRRNSTYVLEDLKSKIVILTGPRQTGKTTLSKMLKPDFLYFNCDVANHRIILQEESWNTKTDLLIFDELHKMKNWKSWLKGVYDVRGSNPPILVSGSAKIDTYRKMGDSLAGRYFRHRLHPFDVKELALDGIAPKEAFETLLKTGPFPEPFLKGSERFYNRWKKTHLDIILRQDLLDLQTVRDIKSIETLIELLRHRVGSPFSYRSLAEDLQRDPKTVKRWMDLLEELYVVFKITPYHKNIARALQREPKYYFYDTAQIKGDNGAKLENIVAAALLKELHFLEDTEGHDVGLHYLRTKDGKEVDFLVLVNNQPTVMIEVKWKDDTPSRHFNTFSTFFPGIPMVQLVYEPKREKFFDYGLEVRDVVEWLAEFSLNIDT